MLKNFDFYLSEIVTSMSTLGKMEGNLCEHTLKLPNV